MPQQPPDQLAAVEAELQSERAYALGLAGKKVEAAMADVERARPEQLEDLLDDAGTAVWHYLIMRESLGMFDHKEALEIYGIPPRVLVRVGIIRRTRRP